MTEEERIYVVDRLEADLAVLVPDDEDLLDENVSRHRFPPNVAEGDVLRVPLPLGHHRTSKPL